MIAERALRPITNPPVAEAVLEAPPESAPATLSDAGAAAEAPCDDDPLQIDYSQIVTEDDTPVDNLLSERQQRLLADSLYASWSGPGAGRPFIAMTNVGLFYALHQPPYVPDALVSLDVLPPTDLFPKRNRSYFIWEYGKPPEIVVEVVSNREGGELDAKVAGYARIGIPYYIVFDPYQYLGEQLLYVFALRDLEYVELAPGLLRGVALGVTLWEGDYEDLQTVWLRWVDADGALLLTGKERALQAEAQAEQERNRAEQERNRAEHAYQRAERLAVMLREMGVDPDGVG